MSRPRASVRGGYARKTVSLPARLVARLEKHLRKNEGLTMSALITEAAEKYLRLKDQGGLR